MRVNRIHFRGVKSRKRLFAMLPVLLMLAACQPHSRLVVHTSLIASMPRVIDIEIADACSLAKFELESLANPGRTKPLVFIQKQDFQPQTPTWHARVLLDSRSTSDENPPVWDVLHLDCPSHGSRRIELSDPPQSSIGHTTPDWAKGLVWYQVFPERFANGNPRNDPNGWDLTPMDWDTSFDQVSNEEIERAWNRAKVDPRRFAYRTDSPGGAISQVITARRFGGDLMGVYEHLEELIEQGVSGIYLCPMFQSRSLHKYDADDHRHIDPTLGHPGRYDDPGPQPIKLLPGEDPADERTWAWTPADQWFVDKFLPKAKTLGLRVILDGVWNHVGTNHFAFADVIEHGASSPYADWFEVEFDDNGQLFAWKSWNGVNGNLPVFRQTESGDLAPGPKGYVMAVTRQWMDPNADGDPSDGVDGWRLDVAGEIGDPFWKDWRAQVRSVNPEALVIAELWGDADKQLHADGFDGQMNYPFAYAIADWLSIGGQYRHDAKMCAQRLQRVFHHNPQHDLVQMNLMDSHDTERLVSLMHNHFARGYDNDASPWDPSHRYHGDQATDDDREIALVAIAAMVASPGSVMIYNGDEYAITGADDPDNRRPIPWDQLKPDSSSGPTDPRLMFNQQVRQLLNLRSDPKYRDVLRFGAAEFSATESGQLIIRRQLDNQVVEIILSPTAEQLDHDESAHSGKITPQQLYERSRKFGLKPDCCHIEVRVMFGK